MQSTQRKVEPFSALMGALVAGLQKNRLNFLKFDENQ
jgi:hypothetical protein